MIVSLKNVILYFSDVFSSGKKKKTLQSFIDKGGEWLHIDMAGPSSDAERSTAYGVALMYSLVKTIDGQDK